MDIRLRGEQIGVEISNVDVRTMSDADFGRIYQAWIDHNVMVVKQQELTIPEFLTYSRRFGNVVPHPSKSPRHPEYPDITMLGINKFGADGKLNQVLPPDSPTRAVLANGVGDATVEIRSAADGIVRIYSYHVLERYPFFVSVGISHDDALATWRLRSLVVAVLVVLMLATVWSGAST